MGKRKDREENNISNFIQISNYNTILFGDMSSHNIVNKNEILKKI